MTTTTRRTRRTRVLGVALGAAVATGTVALTPAVAQAAPASSKVYVTHGLPLDDAGTKVDVFAGAAGSGVAGAGLVLDDFVFGETRGPLDLPAASYSIYLATPTAGDDGTLTSDEVVYAQDLAVPAGQNLSVVASFTADAKPNLAVFSNDLSATKRYEGRLSIRHAAAAPAVNVDLGLFPFNRIFPKYFTKTVGPASNGQQADLDVFAWPYDVKVKVASSGATVAGVDRFPVKPRTLTNVYAVGVPGKSFTFMTQTIPLASAKG